MNFGDYDHLILVYLRYNLTLCNLKRTKKQSDDKLYNTDWNIHENILEIIPTFVKYGLKILLGC